MFKLRAQIFEPDAFFTRALLSFEHKLPSGRARGDYTLKDTSHLRDIQRTGDTSLVSGRAGVTLPARVLQAGSSDETWSVWMRETLPDNAKQERRMRLACGA